jgi:hypothetical protein
MKFLLNSTCLRLNLQFGLRILSDLMKYSNVTNIQFNWVRCVVAKFYPNYRANNISSVSQMVEGYPFSKMNRQFLQ